MKYVILVGVFPAFIDPRQHPRVGILLPHRTEEGFEIYVPPVSCFQREAAILTPST